MSKQKTRDMKKATPRANARRLCRISLTGGANSKRSCRITPKAVRNSKRSCRINSTGRRANAKRSCRVDLSGTNKQNVPGNLNRITSGGNGQSTEGMISKWRGLFYLSVGVFMCVTLPFTLIILTRTRHGAGVSAPFSFPPFPSLPPLPSLSTCCSSRGTSAVRGYDLCRPVCNTRGSP